MQRDYNSDGFFLIIKGAGTALGISFLLVLVFASILCAAPLPDKVVYPVNQIIKAVSILLGTLFFVRGEKGWLKGLGIGGLFTLVSYLTFSVLGGFSLTWLAFLELFSGCIVGALGGIIAVNVKK